MSGAFPNPPGDRFHAMGHPIFAALGQAETWERQEFV
jgi:hypothetical protein